uniref:Crossover junction endonuclease MUS81 n=1 Tax=Noctiluca scintillans TaxID=2966 RepID=A0A7S1B0M9_NOCSC
MHRDAQGKPKRRACHPGNGAIFDRLDELRLAAEEKGNSRQARSYHRVLCSLKKYPLPIKAASEAMCLIGVGKTMSSIFEEVLAKGDVAEDDCLWRQSARRRFYQALRQGSRACPRASHAAPSQKAQRKSSNWRPWKLDNPNSPGTERNLATPAKSGTSAPEVKNSTPSRVLLGRRLSIAAKQRANERNLSGKLSPGSGQWSIMVALGLYGLEAFDRSLSLVDIERSLVLLRPLLRCQRNWTPAIGLLTKKGLVEAAGSDKYRLTEEGGLIAEGLLRKLKVPLSALPQLSLGEASSQLVTLNVEESPPDVDVSDDDKPLSRLGAPDGHDNRAEPVDFPSSPARAPVHDAISLNVSWPSFVPTPEVSSNTACPANGPSLSQFNYLSPANASPQPAKRRRTLTVTRSAPAALPTPCKIRKKFAKPDSCAKERKLVPSSSAPPPPQAHEASFNATHVAESGHLVLLLDHREVGAGREHAARGALLADLTGRLGEESVQGRALPLGDILWVWRDQGREFLAGWIVERKTFSDLSASVIDGRYDEQKQRLLEAPGLQGVVYLVEGAGPLFGVFETSDAEKRSNLARQKGFGQRLLGRTLPCETLSTVAAHTQLISGFHVAHTASTTNTVALLVSMHEALQSRGPTNSPNAQTGRVMYHDFAEQTRKSCHARVFDVFGRMLRVIPHCGPEATEALINEFNTPSALAAALRDASDTELLLRLKARRGGRAPVSASALAACRELFLA